MSAPPRNEIWFLCLKLGLSCMLNNGSPQYLGFEPGFSQWRAQRFSTEQSHNPEVGYLTQRIHRSSEKVIDYKDPKLT